MESESYLIGDLHHDRRDLSTIADLYEMSMSNKPRTIGDLIKSLHASTNPSTQSESNTMKTVSHSIVQSIVASHRQDDLSPLITSAGTTEYTARLQERMAMQAKDRQEAQIDNVMLVLESGQARLIDAVETLRRNREAVKISKEVVDSLDVSIAYAAQTGNTLPLLKALGHHLDLQKVDKGAAKITEEFAVAHKAAKAAALKTAESAQGSDQA